MRTVCRAAIWTGALLATTCAQAQENIIRPIAGSKEIGLSGNFTTVGGVTTYDVVVDGGLYLTDRLVALGRVGFGKHSPPQQEYFIGARYDIRHGGGSIPYALAGVEFHNGERQGSESQMSRIIDPSAGPKATVFEGGLGMDFFLSSHTSAFAELVAFKASGGSDTGANLRIGIRMFFK
ncbi:MAG TPA: hypothetical protein VG820_05655 [Fimbriimonadaceae bacterium]|nr:hypothetical protein [Fimbriimonadaceae bacterium]